MINGAWPEGTKLYVRATRDTNEVNGAWHTEGASYEMVVAAEDDLDRESGQANHVRLVGCSAVPRAPQGVIKPEKLRSLTEQHWQVALRDSTGHNFNQRVAFLKSSESRLPGSTRIEVFVPNDIASSSWGWYAATVHAYSAVLRRFRLVYDVDTARENKKGEKDIDTWEDLLMLARKLCVRGARVLPHACPAPCASSTANASHPPNTRLPPPSPARRRLSFSPRR